MTGSGELPAVRRMPAPEAFAGSIALVLVAAIGAGVLAGGPGGDPGSSPAPVASRSPSPPVATPLVDPSRVLLLRELNEQLVGRAQALQDGLDRRPFQTAEVASTIRQVNGLVLYGVDAVASLGGALGEAEAGGRLAALYRTISDTATKTLDASLTNDAEYRVGAGVLVQLIGGLPAIQAELEELAKPPSGSPPPSGASAPPPSDSPSVAPSSTPPPSRTPAPSASPPPASPPPSSVPGEQIVNGGFEAGVAAPWTLLIAPGSSATLRADAETPGAGTASARIDITSSGEAYSGISLQQPGLRLEAGGQYTLLVALRSARERDVRIRIASPDGASYLTRVAPVTSAWSTQSFVFIAPVSDSRATLEIDLGRSTVTTWIDGVSLRPGGIAAPAVVASPSS